ILRKLPPRLYSIASSHKANPDEVHLTVAAVRYESHGRKRKGVASCFLAERVAEGDPLPIYVEVNRNFKLPVDSGVPIIMVGPGTGVAPFRRSYRSARRPVHAVATGCSSATSTSPPIS